MLRLGPSRFGDSGRAAELNRCVAYGYRPRLAPSGSQCHRPVAHREVGRFKLAPCDAASGPEQVGDSGRAAELNWCVAYGYRPRLAPSGSQCHRPVAHSEPTSASGWAI